MVHTFILILAKIELLQGLSNGYVAMQDGTK